MKKPINLEKQAEIILQRAEEKGVQSNFFFATTFKRYQVQMQALSALEEAIKEHGPTVTKEYVKGRENLVVNPAITEYNKTSTAANGTVATLINILKSLTDETAGQSKLQAFMDAINE
jgi:RecB family exonuclease